MTVGIESVDLVFDYESSADAQQLMYFVKRPVYEIAFVVPAAQKAARQDQAHCHVRFKTAYQTGEVVLDIKHLADFYEDLAGMMEYLRYERAKQ
jgi:hypothetical protein